MGFKIATRCHKFVGSPLPYLVRHWLVERVNEEAVRRYSASAYDGDVTLIRAPIGGNGLYSDPMLGWGSIWCRVRS